ncbi:uncharacterized protein UTRI_01789 [Ustilago trichophora]|uniref:Uncharacterized protein n=1 Tax=Ustilago trichophora TaxID=86804 RepID=A0A5C3E0S2_9BASI|nr:uncharacterized protein UTRI_01789 [Ustilago trichophora]
MAPVSRYTSDPYTRVPDPARHKTCISCTRYYDGDEFLHTYDYVCIECYNKRRIKLEDDIQKWILSRPEPSSEEQQSETSMNGISDAVAVLKFLFDQIQRPFPLPSRE